MNTTGHYDEIAKIEQFRHAKLKELRDKVRRRQAEHREIRQSQTQHQAVSLNKTTTRKAPGGHH